MFNVVLECLDFWRVEHLGRKNLAKMSMTMIPYMITMIRRMTFSLLLIPREGIETCARWLMCEHVVPFRNPWQISMVLSRASTGYGYGWLGLDMAGWQRRRVHPVQLIGKEGICLQTRTPMNPMKADHSEAHRDYVLKMLKLHDYAHGLSTSLEDCVAPFHPLRFSGQSWVRKSSQHVYWIEGTEQSTGGEKWFGRCLRLKIIPVQVRWGVRLVVTMANRASQAERWYVTQVRNRDYWPWKLLLFNQPGHHVADFLHFRYFTKTWLFWGPRFKPK